MLNPEKLARRSARRPWTTIVTWIIILVGGGLISSRAIADVLTTEANFTNRPESRQALELVEDRLRGPHRATEIVIVQSESATVDDPAFEEFVTGLKTDLVALGPDAVQSAATFYETDEPTLVSADRRSTLVPVVMAGGLDDASDHVDELRGILKDNGSSGFNLLVAGEASLSEDFSTIAEEDLQQGETFGVLIALAVLLVVFGAVVAALLPIGLAIAAITIALGAVALIGQLYDFSFFVTNMITMIGLAVGIDYSLFIVSRYREERRHGLDKHEAIAASGATASRAVFFSGMAVALALLGMFIIPMSIFRSLAAGAALVVLIAVAASMTLLPAMLSLLGDRVNSLRIFRPRGSARDGNRFWDRVSYGVMRRPVVSVVLGAGLLIAASVSYFSINTGFAGVSTLPDGVESKRAFGVLSTEFSGGVTLPVEIVISGDVTPEVEAGIERMQGILARDQGFGPSGVEVNDDGDLALISAPVAGDPASEAAVASISRIRDEYIPQAFGGTEAEVLVGGQTAISKDFFDLTDSYTPIVFLFVLGLSFLLLMVVFRSIVVPIKAIIMNLLSVGAAYGLIVLVFQKGVGAGILGFQEVEAIEAWLPLFLFSVLFGLSMDYHVFLLSRIRERFDQTGDNAESVAFGLRTTGGIITGAALIMVAVFAGFAAGNLVPLQQMGFGLAVAVLIDATIVRSILVPASMKLLGNLNWYLPKWLQWLPEIHVEGTRVAEVPKAVEVKEPVSV